MPSSPFRLLCALCVASNLLSGCATTPATPEPPSHPRLQTTVVQEQHAVPVMRYGRYTLIELGPTPAQRDLMQQVVDVSIPATFNVKVGDAMRYVLRHSGYQLCSVDNTTALVTLPLPAADLHLGPMTLREALLILADPAWKMSVDETTRSVCFHRHGTPTATPDSTPSISPVPGAVMDTPVDPFDPLQPWEPQP